MAVVNDACCLSVLLELCHFHIFIFPPIHKQTVVQISTMEKSVFQQKWFVVVVCVCVVFFLSGAVLSSVDMHNNGRNHTMPPKIIMNS